ncbi:hypothetical protein [Pseudoruegeria sp. SK021]|uniref:hypothetical protein n=1 Tax=Pseudoruegeria sp. SK021 TaxID=1933035 RepID=UPI000A21B621|nr:hypothetical protein [Pseudoruegeria sp. SK021]OSP56375.1 hypothetical protein BV911_03565 [Pseudoruegeria sp. SK021]
MRIFLMIVPLMWALQVAVTRAAETEETLFEVLQVSRLLTVLQAEAVASGLDLAMDMSGSDARDPGWREVVAGINDPAVVGPRMLDDFSDALPDENLPAILEFWQSPDGQEIVALEMSAREALLDPDVAAHVMERFDGVAEDGTARTAQLQEFIAVNNLIESNVLGAMNANAAFLRGLRQGAPLRDLAPGTDSGILMEVWSQEPEIRLATVAWLYGYLSLAYQPLSDDDLNGYIAFSASDAGQAFNAALFLAFDRMFVRTSLETGEALARHLTSEDI